MTYDFDLFVIGAGSGGVRAARLAALAGARVGVAEADRAGGTCVIRGCIPKKYMVYASEFARALGHMKGYGWDVSSAAYDHNLFMGRMHAEIDRLSAVYARNLRQAGAELIEDRAVFEGPHTLRLTGAQKTVTAAKILIAVGGQPFLPADVEGVDLAITSDQMFHLPDIPETLAIIGGGYIAVEFAGIMSGLGSRVSLIYRGDTVLRGFDEDVRAHVQDELVAKGVKVITGTQPVRLRRAGARVCVDLSSGATEEADTVLYAAGRVPMTERLGLDKAGVGRDARGAIIVDDYSRTNVPHIFAVGDVTDRINLTPVAIREAQAFAYTEFMNAPTTFDHADIPHAVFAQPPVGVVGMTEAEARMACGEIDIYRTRFRPMKDMLTGQQERVLMKLVVRADDQRILGVHIVGPDAPEIIQAVAIAVKMKATKADFDRTCALHPSIAEELVTMREKSVPPEPKSV